MKALIFLAFALTVPAANFMIGNVGSCAPDHPCVIPVGFGLYAPSGVLMIGAALVLRDLVHEAYGLRGALTAILVGAVASIIFAPPALVVASVAAFVLSELSDLAVYQPLRQRRLWLAVALSGLAGSVVDSAVFLLMAFGTLDFVAGQIVGKTWMSLAAAMVVVARRWRLNHG